MNTPIRHGAVNRAALPVPLYEHVKQQISESILMGALAEGTVLPSEAILAVQYGVAVGTIRRALADLASEGLLSRRRKLGTVVTGRAPQHSLRFFFHYFRLHAADGGLVRSETATTLLRRGRATPDEAAQLVLEPEAEVIRIGRTRSVSGRPVMQETVVLPAARLPGFPSVPDQVPSLLYLHLMEAYGIRVAAVREELTAGLASTAERKALLLRRPAAVLRISSLAFDQAGHPVLFGRHAATTEANMYVNEVR